MEYISKKVAAYGQFVLVYYRHAWKYDTKKTMYIIKLPDHNYETLFSKMNPFDI